MFSYSLLICNSFSVFPCFNLYWEFWGRCRHVFCGIFLNLSLIFFWWLDWGYLYQYELVDIYFILWVIIHITLFILFKLFHLWPFSLSLFHIGSSVFLWYPHFFFLVEKLHVTSGLPSEFPTLILESATFPRIFVYFFWMVVYKNQDLDVLIASEMSQLLVPLTEQNYYWLYVYRYWSKHEFTLISLTLIQ